MNMHLSVIPYRGVRNGEDMYFWAWRAKFHNSNQKEKVPGWFATHVLNTYVGIHTVTNNAPDNWKCDKMQHV